MSKHQTDEYGLGHPLARSKYEVVKEFGRHKWLAGAVALVLIVGGAYVADLRGDGVPAKWLPRSLYEELGIAMMVAGLVGIGIDFLALATGRFRRELEFEDYLATISAAARGFKTWGDPLAKIDALLYSLMPSEKYLTFRRSTVDTIRKVSGIRTLEENPERPTEVKYIVDFLGFATRAFVGDVAEKMRGLIENLHKGEEITVSYSPPDRFALNRRLLAAQMSSLTAGDRYDSLCNVRLYTGDGKDEFAKATKAALMDPKITIRRIYNVCSVDGLDRALDDWTRAKAIIDAHISDFQFAGERFQVRFLTSAVLTTSRDSIRTAAANANIDDVEFLRKTFFGIFYHGKDQMIYYGSVPSNAKTLNVTVGRKSLGTKKDEVSLFEVLWECSKGVPSPFA